MLGRMSRAVVGLPRRHLGVAVVLVLATWLASLVGFLGFNWVVGTRDLLALPAQAVSAAASCSENSTATLQVQASQNAQTLSIVEGGVTLASISLVSDSDSLSLGLPSSAGLSSPVDVIALRPAWRVFRNATFEVTKGVSTDAVPALMAEAVKGEAEAKGLAVSEPGSLLKAMRCWVRSSGLEERQAEMLIPRVVNGSIQFVTVAAFVGLCVLVAARWYYCVYAEGRVGSRLSKLGISGEQELLNSEVTASRQRQVLETVRSEKSKGAELSESVHAHLIDNVLGWRLNRVPPAQIPNLLELEASSEKAMMEAGYSMPQYLAWAIPLLGFIGTIVGVSRAMGAAELVGSPERVAQLLARSRVTGEIAVAFDTTLVALVLSLIGVWFISISERRERELHENAKVLALGVAATSIAVKVVKESERRRDKLQTERAEALARLRRLQTRQASLEADGRVLGAQAALFDVKLSHTRESVSGIGNKITATQATLERIERELADSMTATSLRSDGTLPGVAGTNEIDDALER